MARGHPEEGRRRGATAGLVLAFAVLAWHVSHSDFLIDDAYISFRYAAHWAGGNGLVFNPGEAPVEGFSNFLWVALLALAARLGVPLELASRALSIAAATTTVALLHRALTRHGFSPRASAIGTLSLAAFPPFATWATGGLETALFTLLVFLAFDALTAPARSTTSTGAVLVVTGLLLPLVRTDGFAFVLALALTGFLAGSPDARRRLRPLLAAAVVSFGLYLAWRRVHFGLWVANTVRAKADPSLALVLRGLRTTASYLVVFGTPLLALASLLPGRPASPEVGERRTFALAATLLLGAFLAYDTLVGGDWMPMFRLLAPASPLLAVALAGLVDRLGPRRGTLVGLLAVGVALLPSFGLSVAPRKLRAALDFRGFRTGYQSERERWRRGVENLETFVAIGKGLAGVAAPGESLTAGAIGAIGYHSGLVVLDRNGLVEPSVAALPPDPRGRSAGHDKRVPRSHFLDRSPTYFEAVLVAHTIPGPESPAFAKAARNIGRFVFGDPGDAVLLEHSLPETHPLEPADGIPPGHSLVLLRATDDRARARELWKSLGF